MSAVNGSAALASGNLDAYNLFLPITLLFITPAPPPCISRFLSDVPVSDKSSFAEEFKAAFFHAPSIFDNANNASTLRKLDHRLSSFLRLALKIAPMMVPPCSPHSTRLSLSSLLEFSSRPHVTLVLLTRLRPRNLQELIVPLPWSLLKPLRLLDPPSSQ